MSMCVSNKFSRLTRQSRFLLSAVVITLGGLCVVETQQAQAQSRPPEASGVTIHKPRPGSHSATPPSGPGKSRLRLIDPSVFPIGGPPETQGATPGGTPGSSLRKSGATGPTDGGVATQNGYDDQAYGSRSEKWPYTTARVAVSNLGPSSSAANTPVTSAPYRFTGKLWSRYGSDWFVCTASLIKPGVLLTAAHCVHNYGQQGAGFADEVRWYPANISDSFSSPQPYGMYQAESWIIPTVYYNGKDTCQSGAKGVVCNNDIAVVVLYANSGVRAGDALGGTLGYGWNGYSFIASPAFGSAKVTDITQLGYPVALDNGYQMERTNSFGKYVAGTGANGKALKNTQLGSAQTGGSSGGPWIVNFGTRPSVDSSSASLGSASDSNIVVGVTSWGYTTVGSNVQGASWFGKNPEFPLDDYGGFGAGNIGAMVQAACTNYPGRC